MDLKKEYEQVIANNPFAGRIGMEITEIREGFVSVKVKMREELENIYGDMHGGCLYTIADNMAGVAAATYGYQVTTVNGSIQYLKAVRNTEYVICQANVVKPGKTISVVHVDIRDDKGMLLNTAEFTYFNLRRKDEKR